jgi:hypothetical protein
MWYLVPYAPGLEPLGEEKVLELFKECRELIVLSRVRWTLIISGVPSSWLGYS